MDCDNSGCSNASTIIPLYPSSDFYLPSGNGLHIQPKKAVIWGTVYNWLYHLPHYRWIYYPAKRIAGEHLPRPVGFPTFNQGKVNPEEFLPPFWLNTSPRNPDLLIWVHSGWFWMFLICRVAVLWYAWCLALWFSNLGGLTYLKIKYGLLLGWRHQRKNSHLEYQQQKVNQRVKSESLTGFCILFERLFKAWAAKWLWF